MWFSHKSHFQSNENVFQPSRKKLRRSQNLEHPREKSPFDRTWTFLFYELYGVPTVNFHMELSLKLCDLWFRFDFSCSSNSNSTGDDMSRYTKGSIIRQSGMDNTEWNRGSDAGKIKVVR